MSGSPSQALWQELLRRHPRDPYAWTMAHRTIGGQALDHLPPIMELMRDPHPFVVVMKAAQVGLSEAAINLALYATDRAHAGRGNVSYFMPTQTLMDDFTQGRIDPALQNSAYLRGRLQPEPPARKGADSKHLKHLGAGFLYLRGADSRRQLSSIPADWVLLDEYDLMAQGTLQLARKRLSSSRDGRLWVLSTPRLPEAGIHELFLRSDQRHYAIPCAGCGREQALRWPENVDCGRELVVCAGCRQPLDTQAAGRWMPQAPGNSAIHGYHLNRLYSPWLDLHALIEASQETAPAALRVFHNADLGQPFCPPGGGLTVDVLDRCRQGYDLRQYRGQECVMGVDVGTVLHVVIRERADDGRRLRAEQRPGRLWYAGEVRWEELEALRERFNVQHGLIDALPEMYQARRLAEQSAGRIWLAYYDRQQAGHEYQPGSPAVLHLNRTEALDELAQRFREQLLPLPAAARGLGGRIRDGLGDYYRQLLVLQRDLEPDANGNLRARWRDYSRPDHYAHAELYCMLAATLSSTAPNAFLVGDGDGWERGWHPISC